MFGLGALLRGLSLILMWYISNPKLMKLSPPENKATVPSNQDNKQQSIAA